MICFDELIESLNSNQKEAVLYDESPQIVVAGAGSGKTRVLTLKIVYYCAVKNVNPKNILAITFTNKAADELKNRLEEYTLSDVCAGTFHSLCLKILQVHGSYCGFNKDFTVYDEYDQVSVIKECLSEIPAKEKPAYIAEWINRRKDDLEEPQDSSPDTLERIYCLYEKKLKTQNALDFADLILKTVRLLRDYPDLVKYYNKKFTHILVDEYQDTNSAQAAFLELLAGQTKDLFVVGDPDQSIYSWRGANINNLLKFNDTFTDAKLFKLEQNYRSTNLILKASNNLIEKNVSRYEKKLWSEKKYGDKIAYYNLYSDRQEAVKLADIITDKKAAGLSYSDMAVFYRTHHLSRIIEETFIERGIPYNTIGGLPFYQRKEIKDILCYLRIIANTSDKTAFKRIINVPPRKIGDKSVEKLEIVSDKNNMDFYSVMKESGAISGLPKPVRNVCCFFVDFIEKYKAKFNESPDWGIIIKEMIDEIGYMKYLEDTEPPEKMKTKKENLLSLIDSADQFRKENPDSSLSGFLEKTALVSSSDEWDSDDGMLSLMTLHCAKGLEFKAVFMVGLEEKLFPYYRDFEDPAEIEEERRLFYVGMTRAKDQLYLFSSRKRFSFAGPTQAPVSRFISEIPYEYMDYKDYSNNYGYYDEPEYAKLSSYIDEFNVGDTVYHAEMGKGKVLGGSGYGKNKKLLVYFEGESERRTACVPYIQLSRYED